MKSPKIKRGEGLIRFLVDKMLKERHGVDFDYVVKNQTIEGTPWYQYYTWTEQEQEQYRRWFIEVLTKHVTPKYPRREAERIWDSFNLNYGLKVVETNDHD
jgi:hypothetical protein